MFQDALAEREVLVSSLQSGPFGGDNKIPISEDIIREAYAGNLVTLTV